MFLGKAREVFAFLHLPVSSPVAALLVCSPLEAESARHYRKEVLLGRRLAGDGVAVMRFHYRGQGHSRGHLRDMSYPSMVADALRAIEHLRLRAGTPNLALLGTRFGALIAGSVASRIEGAPLVLWEPALDASSYFREVLRYRLMQELKHGGKAPSMDDLVDEGRTRGSVEILGFEIPWSLYQSSHDKSLLRELGDPPRPLLLVQMQARERLARPYLDFVSACRNRGLSVESVTVREAIPWWFVQAGGQPIETGPGTDALLETSGAWLSSRLSSEVTAR